MTPDNGRPRAGLAYFFAVLGAFLIVAGLVWIMRGYIQPAPLDQERAAVRSKALAELRAAEATALRNPGWIDQGKGVVRLPIDTAMEVVLREWNEDPAALRADLLDRVAKATAVPPKPPEQPSEFE